MTTKRKPDLSPEERARRAERMREAQRKRWANKKASVEPPKPEVEIVVQKPYVYAKATLNGVTAHGFAKCNPVDTWNEDLGTRIAKGRALKKLKIMSNT